MLLRRRLFTSAALLAPFGSAWAQPADEMGAQSQSGPFGPTGNFVGPGPGPGPGPLSGPSLDLNFINASAMDSRLVYTGSGGTIFNAAGAITAATTNVPRIDYDPVTHACRGLLVEEARTNLVVGSSDFTTWSFPVGGGTLTANTTVGPDGTLTADTQTKPAAAEGVMRRTVTVPSDTNPYCFSVFLQQGTAVYTQIAPSLSGSVFPTVVLRWSDHTVVSRGGANAALGYGVQNMGGGYWRLWCSTPNTSQTSALFDIRAAGDSVAGYGTGSEIGTVIVWGAQMEQGAFPTSYIPTTTVAVTRTVDAATLPISAGWYSSAAGSLVCNANAMVLGTAGFFQIPVMLDDNTTTNRIALYRTSASSALNWIVNVPATSFNPAIGTMTPGTAFTAGISLNGVAAYSALSGTAGPTGAGQIPAGLLTLRLGDVAGGGQNLNGYVRRIRYWPRALGNNELQLATL